MFRELTRKKQALTPDECLEILRKEPRGVLCVNGDNGYPYGMPMNFYYSDTDRKIYFHSGRNGHKIDALKRDGKVSFCVYDSGYRKPGEWALNIKSVVVFGRVTLIDSFEKTVEISRELSYKYTDDSDYIENEIKKFAASTLCFAITPEHICGKLVNEK